MATDLPSYSLSLHSCQVCGKACYRSRRDARRAGRSLWPGMKVRAYRCAGAWHFTTKAHLFPHPGTTRSARTEATPHGHV